MSLPVIRTPKGFVWINAATMKAEIYWKPGMGPTWGGRFTKAQYFVDSECLRGCEPYIPLRTGMLIDTGLLATELGSGVLRWIAPYAHRQYYSKRKPGSLTGPLRGPFWFKRWKAVGWSAVVAGARKIAGGGA